jgi:hypothetical protein
VRMAVAPSILSINDSIRFERNKCAQLEKSVWPLF